MNYVANGNLFFQKQQNNPLLFIFPSLLSPDVLFTRCCYHHCHFYLRRQDCSGLTSLLSDMLTSWMPKMSSYESITDKPFLYGIIILMNIKKFIELSSVVFLQFSSKSHENRCLYLHQQNVRWICKGASLRRPLCMIFI